MLEVSQNTLISKSLMASKIQRYNFFCFSKILRLQYLHGNQTALVTTAIQVDFNKQQLAVTHNLGFF